MLFHFLKYLAFLLTMPVFKAIAKAVESSSFKTMLELDKQRSPNFQSEQSANIPFVRKGETKVWKNYLTDKQEKQLIETFQVCMKKFHYT